MMKVERKWQYQYEVSMREHGHAARFSNAIDFFLSFYDKIGNRLHKMSPNSHLILTGSDKNNIDTYNEEKKRGSRSSRQQTTK